VACAMCKELQGRTDAGLHLTSLGATTAQRDPPTQTHSSNEFVMLFVFATAFLLCISKEFVPKHKWSQLTILCSRLHPLLQRLPSPARNALLAVGLLPTSTSGSSAAYGTVATIASQPGPLKEEASTSNQRSVQPPAEKDPFDSYADAAQRL
jgi:hypothetical protein